MLEKTGLSGSRSNYESSVVMPQSVDGVLFKEERKAKIVHLFCKMLDP